MQSNTITLNIKLLITNTVLLSASLQQIATQASLIDKKLAIQNGKMHRHDACAVAHFWSEVTGSFPGLY